MARQFLEVTQSPWAPLRLTMNRRPLAPWLMALILAPKVFAQNVRLMRPQSPHRHQSSHRHQHHAYDIPELPAAFVARDATAMPGGIVFVPGPAPIQGVTFTHGSVAPLELSQASPSQHPV